MEQKEFIVSITDNIRIDKYLADKVNDLSRSYIQDLIEQDKVIVNNKIVKKSYLVKQKDQIIIKIPTAEKSELKPVEMDLDILYEDNDIIVINKAPGLTVHPVPGNRSHTLVNALLAYTDDLSGINGVIRPGIVHRLDRDTSGVMVVAKNNNSHQQLVNQFKKRKTKKIYHALIKGKLNYRTGKIDAPIGRDPANRTKMAVTKKNSKKAVSIFKVLEEFDDCTYVEITLKTGRTHQIRVHFSYIGHPVIGDTKYGYPANKFAVNRQLLHAYLLGFNHPIKEKWMEFKAPLPEDFSSILNSLHR